MNIRHLFTSLQAATICLSLVTGTVFGQQIPSSLEDGTVEQAPITEPGNQTTPVVRPGQDLTPRADFTPPQDREPTEDQEVMINTKYAGWEEINTIAGGQRLSDIIRGNWVMIDPNGRFDGRVAPGEGAEVADMNIFLMNKGRLVKQTTVDGEGRFQFTNVRQGSYALIGWGKNGFFAFGLNILAYNPQNNGTIVNTVNATAYQNQTTINTDWIKYYAPQVSFRVYGRYPVGEGRDDPAELYGFSGLYENIPASTVATSISGRPVVKTADDRVLGRVHQLTSNSGRPVDVRSTKVMLFQGDEVVASTTTDNYGGFEFPQVPDGSYGLTAVGVDGVGMIGIDVVSGGSSALGEIAAVNATPVDFTMVSAETIGWLSDYAAEVAYRRALLAPRPPAPVKGYNGYGFGCPMCGNQPGGCSACQGCADCKSRCLTFEQWAQNGCQCSAQKFGDGSILEAFAKQTRKYVERSNAIYDKAFYPQMDLNGINMNQPYPNQGYPNQGYPNQAYPNQAYPNQAYPYQQYGN